MKKLIAATLSLSLILAPLADAFGANKRTGGRILQMVGLTNGLLGTTLIGNCTIAYKVPSTVIYMAGGIAYIGSELFSARSQAGAMDSSFSDLMSLQGEIGPGGGVQKEIIETQITNKKALLKQSRNRKNWSKALTAVYLTATISAVAEAIWAPALTPLCSSQGFAEHKRAKVIEGFAKGYDMVNMAAVARSGGEGGALVAGAGKLASKVIQPMLLTSTGLSSKLLPKLNTGSGRAVWFGASATLTGLVWNELSKEERGIKNEISGLEKQLKALAGTQDGEAITEDDLADAEGAKVKKKDKQYALRQLTKAPELKPHCLSKGGTGFSSDACADPAQMTRPNLENNIDLPTLRAASNGVVDWSNAVASGNMERANVEAANLAGMAGKLHDLNTKLQQKLNEKLKAEGKPPIDFETEIQKQVAAMQDNAASAMGSSASAPELAASETTPEEKKVEESRAVNSGKAPTTEIAGGDGLDMLKESDLLDKHEDALMSASLENNLGEYEISEQDISKQPEVSIFKQLSHRYLLNYSRFFVEKKPSLEAE
jgi:hypothetical protein